MSPVEVFERHLWYLNVVPVGLAIFDPGLDDAKKTRSASVSSDMCEDHIQVNEHAVMTKGVVHFVTSSITKLFVYLKVGTGFLDRDPKSCKVTLIISLQRKLPEH